MVTATYRHKNQIIIILVQKRNSSLVQFEFKKEWGGTIFGQYSSHPCTPLGTQIGCSSSSEEFLFLMSVHVYLYMGIVMTKAQIQHLSSQLSYSASALVQCIALLDTYTFLSDTWYLQLHNTQIYVFFIYREKGFNNMSHCPTKLY